MSVVRHLKFGVQVVAEEQNVVAIATTKALEDPQEIMQQLLFR
jgi:hypothetical protein